MKRSRWPVIIALLVFALLLSGCINITQEYWLNADGSAKIGIDLGMSEALLNMSTTGGGSGTSNPFDELKQEYNTHNPDIKNVEVKEYKDNSNGTQHFAVTFEVANFENFLKTQTAQEGELNITLTHLPDGNVSFKQLTQLNTGGDQTSGLDPANMETLFKDMYWSVIIHVPQVISTNGTKVDNNTVEWKIPMTDVFSGKAPDELDLVYKPQGTIGGGGVFGGLFSGSGSSGSSPLLMIVGVLAIFILGGAVAVYLLVFRKRPAGVSSGYAGYAQPPAPRTPHGNYPVQPNNLQTPYPPQPQPGNAPYSPPPQPGYPAYQPSPDPQKQTTQPGRSNQQVPQYPQYPQAPQYPPISPQGGYYYPPQPPQTPPPQQTGEPPAPSQDDPPSNPSS